MSGAMPSAGGANNNASSGLTCFACHRPGRFQSPCTFPPFCLICREEGHLTVSCTNHHNPPSIKQFDLGLPGCGFFRFEGSLGAVTVAPQASNAAISSVQTQGVTLQMLADELKEWGLEDWDWKLQQLSLSELGVVFPSQESLRMLSKSTSFTLPLNQLVVSVKKARDEVRSFG